MIMRFLLSIALGLSLFTSAASSAVLNQPTPTEIQRVLDYYYNGIGQAPILTELKLCDGVIKEGENKNNCRNEISPSAVTLDTDVFIWMNFLVPKNTTANILLQLNHKGITRITRSTEMTNSIRYRTWSNVRFSRTGDWVLKVFYENGDDVRELYAGTVTVSGGVL